MSYFDLQINGYGGVDLNDPMLTLADCRRACLALEGDGVSGILATLITDEIPAMAGKLRNLVRFREEDELIHRVIRGFHLEGPFINGNPGFVGAHPVGAVQPASVRAMEELLASGAGQVRLVTLAPECDQALETTRFLAGQGIAVSAGHCNPGYELLGEAIEAGVTLFTHVGNGCPLELARHDNIIQRVLAYADRLNVCWIPDGHHIPFFALRNYLRACDPARVIMTTDAMAAAGLGPGRYGLSGTEVEVDAFGVARRPGSPYLAGSTLRGTDLAKNLRRELGYDEEMIGRLYGSNPLAAVGLKIA
jgi:N-acetylglucosamine-6-phosphate deacetylase